MAFWEIVICLPSAWRVSSTVFYCCFEAAAATAWRSSCTYCTAYIAALFCGKGYCSGIQSTSSFWSNNLNHKCVYIYMYIFVYAFCIELPRILLVLWHFPHGKLLQVANLDFGVWIFFLDMGAPEVEALEVFLLSWEGLGEFCALKSACAMLQTSAQSKPPCKESAMPDYLELS